MRRAWLAALATLYLGAGAARAQTPSIEACTLVLDAASGAVIARRGTQCASPNSPASTFKVALALLGFQSGYLKGPHDPMLPYRAQIRAEREVWRRPTDPAYWLKESVVWYSQAMTRAWGAAKFQREVDLIEYGNRDLAGDPGKSNGVTNAWLSSSLRISPDEQAAFLRRLLDHSLPVPRAAIDQTMAIMPAFSTDGWAVHGKTGTGFQPRRGGVGVDRDRQFGWFVGWADGNGQRVVFARLIKDTAPSADSAGLRARDSLLIDLPQLAK